MKTILFPVFACFSQLVSASPLDLPRIQILPQFRWNPNQIDKILYSNSEKLTMANVEIDSYIDSAYNDLELIVDDLYETLDSDSKSLQCMEAVQTSVESFDLKISKGALEPCRQTTRLALAGAKQDELSNIVSQVNESLDLCSQENGIEPQGFARCINSNMSEGLRILGEITGELDELLAEARDDSVSCVITTVTVLDDEANQIEETFNECV